MFWHEFKQAMDKINNMDKIKDMVFEYINSDYKKYFIPQEKINHLWYGLILDKKFNIIDWNSLSEDILNANNYSKLTPKTLDTLWKGDVIFYIDFKGNKVHKKVLQRTGDIVFLSEVPDDELDNEYSVLYSIQELKDIGYKIYQGEEKGGNSGWSIDLKDVEKINPTDLEYAQEGDIMHYPESKTYSKVLGRCGRVLYTTDWYESLKEAQEDIDLDYANHTIDAYKKYGYIRYVPEEEEVEELTMEDVCKELGRTIKIKK